MLIYAILTEFVELRTIVVLLDNERYSGFIIIAPGLKRTAISV